MSRAAVVARLAIHELWISFRLFAIAAAFVAAGAVVALLPSPLAWVAGTLAAILGVATTVTAAVAAWSIAAERRAGRAGWLVTRSVSRGTLLAGWFIGLGAVALAGTVAAGVLGWLAAASVAVALQPTGYVALLAGAACTTLAAVALGLAVGAVLPAGPAALVTVAICAAAIVAAWLLPGDPTFVPGGGFPALAALTEPGTATGPGLRAAGVGLTTTGLLLGAARLVLDRAEL